MTPQYYALVAAAGEALLHFLWQGLLIASLLELVLVGMRSWSPDARYLVRCLALLAMAAAPVATFALVLEPAGSHGPGGAAVAVGAPLSVWFWIVTAWALGATVLSARLAGGWARARSLRSLARSAQLPARWQRTFDRIARDLGVRAIARAVDSAVVGVPTMIGWLKPVVLIPVRVLTGLSEDQIEAVLAHELAHVRRCDYLVNLLQSAVEALLFYHPAVWRVSSGVRSEREFCCDDVALSITGDGVSYARALAELESWRTASVGVGVSTLGGSLMHRIQRLVGIHTECAAAGPRRVLHALGTLLVAGTVGATALGLSHGPAPMPHDGGECVNPTDSLLVQVHERTQHHGQDTAQSLVQHLVHALGEKPEPAQGDDHELMRVIERIHERLHAVREHIVRLQEPGERPHDRRKEVVIERHVDRGNLHLDIVERLHHNLEKWPDLHGKIVETLHDHLSNLDIGEVNIDRANLHERIVQRLHDRLKNREHRDVRVHRVDLRERIVERLHDRLKNRELRDVRVHRVDLENLHDHLLNLDFGDVMIDRVDLHEQIIETLHDHLKDRTFVVRHEQGGRIIDRLHDRLKLLRRHGHDLDGGGLRHAILERIEEYLPRLKTEIHRLELELPKLELLELEIPKLELLLELDGPNLKIRTELEKPRHLELVRPSVEHRDELVRSRSLLTQVH